jgi:glycosyltransferase involved in cell wall biosynthesis
MISVVIPTYKAPEALETCVQSALSNQAGDNQIIVVVDGFYDLNREVLEKYEDRITILDLETNQGLCKATNLGVYNSAHDRILIVNDDNVFPPNWDVQLLSTYKKGRVVTPNQIEPTPSLFDEFVIQSFGDVDEFDNDGFYELADKLSVSKFTDKGSTLPIFMDKQDYLTVGGWDESYPGAWVVDWEFFYKCDLAGFELVRTHNCHFYHFVSYGTEASVKEKKTKHGKEALCHDWFNYKWGFYPVKRIEDYKVCKR